MVRSVTITLAMFAVSVASFVWSLTRFAHAETAYHAGCLIITGSVWFVDLAFTCAVLIDAGRRWVEYHAHPQIWVNPPEQEQTVLFTSREAVLPAVTKDYIPMSKRPDPITRLDIQQPVKDWRPPVNGN